MKGRIILKSTIIFFLSLFCSLPAYAGEVSITTLLGAVAGQPGLEASRLDIESSVVQLQQAHALLYPKVSGFGSYTLYNSPTNLRPMAPTEVNIRAGDSIPFSKRITRYGLKLDVPLFIKSLYTLADQVKALQQVKKSHYQLQLITRQASVVSVNASLAYASRVRAAMAARIDSLSKTQHDLKLAVKNGRTPESELQKVETLLNTLLQQQNDLLRKEVALRSQLKSLTNIQVTHAVPMTLLHPVTAGGFLGEKQMVAKVSMAEKDLQQAKEKRYPALMLEGALSENSGEAYNTDDQIDRSYNYIGVKITIPLFNRSLHTAIAQKKVQLSRQKQELSQLRIDLAATADNLQQQLPLIEQSTRLAQASLKSDQELLKIAKVAYRNIRMTTEEYLRFETKVLDAEAALQEIYVDRWKIISQQAILYGNDLTGVIQ